MVTLKHLLEAAALVFIFAVFRLLPLDTASALGGWLAQRIGPRLSAQKTAKKNLAMVFPEKSEAERNKILDGMWNNLGRTTAELPRLPGDALFSRVEMRGEENLPTPGKAALFVSGHLGNWELNYPIAHRHGVKTALIYRRANNRFVDALITALRATQCTTLFPKGHTGAVRLMRAIKDGQSLAMLIDQKMNDGFAVSFFGREAMTAPSVAQFSLRYDLPIVPARVIRKRGAHFDAIIYPPVVYEKTGDEDTDAMAIMTKINALLESWIREYPEQWFWVHKRWPND
jgi:Kdo2-lipid IVA lauroyltransferase/acyltransferase